MPKICARLYIQRGTYLLSRIAHHLQETDLYFLSDDAGVTCFTDSLQWHLTPGIVKQMCNDACDYLAISSSCV